MKSVDLKGKIGGAILAFAIIFGIGIASSMTAQAQWRDNDQSRRDRNWRRDRDQNRNNDYWQRERARREEAYRRNRGYDSSVYNNGGYNNGGYGGYNNGYRVEQSQGYQDGLYTGSND